MDKKLKPDVMNFLDKIPENEEEVLMHKVRETLGLKDDTMARHIAIMIKNIQKFKVD